MSYLKVVKKHAANYFFGSVFISLLSFFMLKYYTHAFSPAQFGVLALYTVMFEYIKALVSLNMDSGTTRLYFDYKKNKRDEYLNTIFWLLVMMATGVSILSLIAMPYVSELISPGSEWLYIVTIVSAISSVFVTFFTRILINEQESRLVIKHNVFQAIINHFSSFLFISLINLSLLGRLVGQGVGICSNLLLIIVRFRLKKLFKFRVIFNSKMAKETFLLSLPLILLYFQNIFFAYIDRILLQYYFDSSIVGVYTLGYILGQAISTVYSAVSQAVLPKVYDDFKDNYQEGISSFEVFSYKYYAVLLMLTFVVSLLSPVILKIVSNENYYEAHKVMPFILGGFMMAGLYKVPAMVLSFHKVVWVYPLVSMCSFGFKILLSWYFIPTDGMLGAAFSTFVGLFLYSVILQIICVRHFNKKYAIVVFGGYMLILMIATLAFSTGVSSIY